MLDFVLKHGAAQHLQVDMTTILHHGSSGDVVMEDKEPGAPRRGRAALRRSGVVSAITKHAPAVKKHARANGK